MRVDEHDGLGTSSEVNKSSGDFENSYAASEALIPILM